MLYIPGITKKAAKRTYFLVQLKRAHVPPKDLCPFYTACLRSLINYAAQGFHYSLPEYLHQELERIQERSMRIICPGMQYEQALAIMNLPTVKDHHENMCTATFRNIMNDPQHKLSKLLPPRYVSSHRLRHERTFALPLCKTNRLKNSFFIASARIVNSHK